ncbi:MAG TPA: substrate-binding domain-containing protein [Candidatus Binatia bacterium]|nr:substrate-binding domain-containing protein [Candidatus Binatia bacterium]
MTSRTMNPEIKVLGVFPVEAVVTELAELFRRETGHTVTATFTTSGVIREKLATGESVDVLILNDNEIDELVGQGVVASDLRANIARFGLGVAVRHGAPLPDISTPETLKETLLAAKSIVYADPTRGRGGAHFADVLQRLGIAEAVKGKTLLSTGGTASTEAVARGEAEVSVQGISKHILVEGVTLVGPLPKDLQKVQTLSVGVVARSGVPEIARAFVAFLARPAFKSRFVEEGLDYRE